MAKIDPKSRYADVEQTPVVDRRGTVVQSLAAPKAVSEVFKGYHLRKQGQRLDHLAFRYLADPAGFWRICELNDAMVPDALSEAQKIAIPTKTRPKGGQ